MFAQGMTTWPEAFAFSAFVATFAFIFYHILKWRPRD